jgi:predicted  nucleic acid-binding Zn-ribbon protein
MTTTKNKLSDVIEQRKVTDFNNAIYSLSYTDKNLSVKIEELVKQLEELTDVRTKIAVAGDNTETTVEALWELSKLANSLLNPTVSNTFISGDKIISGTITANRIAANTITASKLG